MKTKGNSFKNGTENKSTVDSHAIIGSTSMSKTLS